jgi:recombinational DNA repair protein RecR
MRVIAGVAIFFVPTLVGLIFKLIGAFGEVKGQYDICSACIANPSGDTCKPCAEDSSSTGCTTVINNINAKYNS